VRDDTRGGGLMPLAYAAERWYARPRALAVLPLETTDGVLAVVAAWNADRASLDDAGLATLRTLAPYAALQLRQMLVQDTLRERAERDALTGLPNRGAFDEKMREEIALFRRYHRPVSVIVIDVDHFKTVNDTYGHDAGDVVLRQVARILAASIRETDFAARLGGEEFAVILPETELSQAVDTADRIRVAVERGSIEYEGQTLSVRASAGVSACPTVVRDPATLLTSADTALYASKQGGRNRVTAASASEPSSASYGKWV
jgi:diguanylate cyclase (GGDEF)-like protein